MNIFNLKEKFSLSKLTVTKNITLGFLIVIFCGTFLLTLPIASRDGNSVALIDALFTAVSCVCVTGLTVFTTVEQWTFFGQFVIITLIQIGGLGLMTLITMLFVFIGKRITLKERTLIKEAFNHDEYSGIVKLLKSIVIGTFILEGVFAVILSLRFVQEPNIGFLQAIWMGIFHSISSFCNAGFDIIGNTSIATFVGDVTINLSIMTLIVLGGLGFSVWIDVIKFLKFGKNESLKYILNTKQLKVNTKIALLVTFFLISFGAIFIFLAEYNNPGTLGSLTFGEKVLASFFQSVTLRTAGYFSIDQHAMTYGSKFISLILMYIGGSSGGTAGGVKTATFTIVVLAVISVVSGKDSIVAFKRSLPFDLLQKALTIMMLNASIIFIATLILSITERGSAFDHEFIDLIYETTSATGTVGLTTGITPHLSNIGKIVISLCMFIGRIGPITAILSLATKNNKLKNAIHYPEERVMIG